MSPKQQRSEPETDREECDPSDFNGTSMSSSRRAISTSSSLSTREERSAADDSHKKTTTAIDHLSEQCLDCARELSEFKNATNLLVETKPVGRGNNDTMHYIALLRQENKVTTKYMFKTEHRRQVNTLLETAFACPSPLSVLKEMLSRFQEIQEIGGTIKETGDFIIPEKNCFTRGAPGGKVDKKTSVKAVPSNSKRLSVRRTGGRLELVLQR